VQPLPGTRRTDRNLPTARAAGSRDLREEGLIMTQGLLIADEDLDSRKQMADIFIEAGYNVTVTNSAANVLHGILKKTAQVILISSEFDEITATELIPLLKKCNRDLTIILVSNDVSLPLIRKLRKEGIFYHALKPVKPEDRDEIRQAVQCAFNSQRNT
jgi:DNA-binding NtrC family response regulator